jgi:hypothetical protein
MEVGTPEQAALVLGADRSTCRSIFIIPFTSHFINSINLFHSKLSVVNHASNLLDIPLDY